MSRWRFYQFVKMDIYIFSETYFFHNERLFCVKFNGDFKYLIHLVFTLKLKYIYITMVCLVCNGQKSHIYF